MIVELSDTEHMLAHQIGMMRQQMNRAAGVKVSSFVSKDKQVQMEVIGVMAEMAFCKWANLYCNLDVVNQSGTTDVIYQGWKCDIKATDREDGQLIVPHWKKKGASDVYILGITKGLSVDFVGFATEDDIINPNTVKDLGYGPTYCMKQSELTRFAEDAK